MAMSMHDGGRQLSQQHNISGGAETEASLFLVQAGVGRQLLLIVRSRGIITTNG